MIPMETRDSATDSRAALRDDKNEHDRDSRLESWIESNPRSPFNFSRPKKVATLGVLSFYSFLAFFCSAGFIVKSAEANYGVSEQVSVLGQSMFLFGIACGSTFLAPISEHVGRKPVNIVGITMFMLLQIPSALSPTFAGVVVTRYITGVFSGIPVANAGGTAADLYPSLTRSYAIFTYSIASLSGEFCAQFIGGYIYQGTGDLKWFYWTCLIAGAVCLFGVVLIPETFHEKVYVKATGDAEEKSGNPVKDVIQELGNTFKMLFTEPIVMALAATTAYLLAIVYIFLQSYPLIFEDQYGFNSGQEGATLLVLALGAIFAGLFQPLQDRLWHWDARRNDGRHRPEGRLYAAFVGIVFLCGGFFWIGFTAQLYPASYQIPMWGGLLVGFGEVAIFNAIIAYTTDCYGQSSATALAAIDLPSETIAAAFAHIGIVIFASLGTKWGNALLGFICLGYMVVLTGLFFMGPRLRNKSPYAE